MILSFSGHRPDKIGGHDRNNPHQLWIYQKIKEKLVELKPEKAISGMALGVDQIGARVCIKLGIPLISAVPFLGQENVWPETSQREYRLLLAYACKIHIVCEGGYAAWKLQRRNEWMVDNSDILLAIYNGDKKGGTANCVNYARSKNKEIIIINPNDFTK